MKARPCSRRDDPYERDRLHLQAEEPWRPRQVTTSPVSIPISRSSAPSRSRRRPTTTIEVRRAEPVRPDRRVGGEPLLPNRTARRRSISVTTTLTDPRRDFRLTVLNPGGRDPAQDFSSGAIAPNDREHAPVNFHGYAACTGGAFQRDVGARDRAKATGAPAPARQISENAARPDELKRQRTNGRGCVEGNRSAPDRAATRGSRNARNVSARSSQAADGCLAATPEALAVLWADGEFIPHALSGAAIRAGIFRDPLTNDAAFLSARGNGTCLRGIISPRLLMARRSGRTVTVFRRKSARAAARSGARSAVPWRAPAASSDGCLIAIISRRWRGTRSFCKPTKRGPGTGGGRRAALPHALCGGDGAIDRLGFPQTCGLGSFVRRIGGTGGATAARSNDSIPRQWSRESQRSRRDEHELDASSRRSHAGEDSCSALAYDGCRALRSIILPARGPARACSNFSATASRTCLRQSRASASGRLRPIKQRLAESRHDRVPSTNTPLTPSSIASGIPP